MSLKEAARRLKAEALRAARILVERRATRARTDTLHRLHDAASDEDAGRIHDVRMNVEMKQ